MSYILEALKKSDQQRQRTAAPTLSTTAIAVAPDRQSRVVHYGVFAALLLGIAIGWWRPWHAVQPALAARPVAAPMPTSPAPEPSRTPQAATRNKINALPLQKAASAVQTGLEKPQTRTQDSAAQHPMPDKPAAPISIAELPASIQQEIPSITVQFHAYSEAPKNRLVGINSRILHEGESVTQELKLEQITPEGVILSFKGYRFEHGIR